MSLSKENIKGRKVIRSLVEQAEWLGHIPPWPIKIKFKSKSYMDATWGTTELKGKGKNQYIELVLDEDCMKTPHGRDLCTVIAVHELAHAITWSGNEKVEDAKTLKYGDHSPEFGFVYAQLWTDLMEGYTAGDEGGDDDNEDC